MPRYRRLTANGETKTLGEWAKTIGVSESCLSARLNKLGLSLEEALEPGDRRTLDAARKQSSLARMGVANPNYKGKTPEEVAEQTKEWRKRNERRIREQQYRKRYGISVEEYEIMLAAQGGVCALCDAECKRGHLSVDHDHETGQIRGLLCRRCNILLGLLEDDCGWLQRAEVYLAKP